MPSVLYNNTCNTLAIFTVLERERGYTLKTSTSSPCMNTF